MQLPEQHTPVGQPADPARQLIEDAFAIERPTSYRDNTPLPAVGTTPPVAQPGRPAMSQRAVDVNTTILTSSVLAATLGGSVTAVLWGSGQADPTVIAWICGSVVAVPVAIVLPVLALKGLMKSAKGVAEAAPATHHHHYNGDVTIDQRSINSRTRGLGKTTNNL